MTGLEAGPSHLRPDEHVRPWKEQLHTLVWMHSACRGELSADERKVHEQGWLTIDVDEHTLGYGDSRGAPFPIDADSELGGRVRVRKFRWITHHAYHHSNSRSNPVA